MIKLRNIFYFVTMFMLITGFSSLAEEVKYEEISEGYIDGNFKTQNLTIVDDESLKNLLGLLGTDPESVKVDFNKEVVALIIPDKSSYPDNVNVKGVEQARNGLINVEYVVDSVPYVPGKDEKAEIPYLLLKVGPVETEEVQVSFRNADPKEPVFVNQSLDDPVKYTNVMSSNTNELFIKYLPLDKGNSWTYEYKSGENTGNQTFSIIAYTQDWSIFDSFFGKSNLALKLDPSGNLFVSSNKGIRPFYTDDVLIQYQEKPFTVKAGTFDKVLVISSPPESAVQFKDVYAEGVGLIYHEHSSAKGSASYSLAGGNVRGRKIP